MKRVVSLLMTILVVVILSACAGTSGVPIEPNKENMIIHIKNNANFDFYGVEVSILGQSPTSVNADGSKINKGESHSFEFSERDFTLDGEATMEVSILKKNNIESQEDVIAIDKKIDLELGNHQELFFEITGDSMDEADLIRGN